MNQVVGQSQNRDTDDQAEIETFDFKGFDIHLLSKPSHLGPFMFRQNVKPLA